MTHGDIGSIYTSSERYTIDVVTLYFNDENCPSLKGKPRLFFIQACRGGELDKGHIIKVTEDMKYKLRRKRSYGMGEKDAAPIAIEPEVFDSLHEPPNNPDFLIVRSTMPNYASFRNIHKGSWFLQALCNELDVNGTNEDILTLLTHVNLNVQEHESNPEQFKQILCISSMLTKILVFDVKARKVRI
jgi:caspase 7